MIGRLRSLDNREQAFLGSALSEKEFMSLEDFFSWYDSRLKANRFEVIRVPLEDLKAWRFESDTGNLVHKSGQFFSIEGIDVTTNFGSTPHWMQPIINQPEIGILGFLTKKINGVLHFLVQAKMEPGNINMLQLSPTVQATRSNFTRVHGGVRPRYLDYFLDRTCSRVLVDQLQSEQGARFLCKRNRNMIVEVEESEPIEVHNDFCWLTLRQLFELLKVENMVNMDSRTVLSSIRFADSEENVDRLLARRGDLEFHQAVLLSALADERLAANDFDTVVSWLTHMKTRYELHVRCIPLNQVEGWYCDGTEIRHHLGRFFSVIGVSVSGNSREVESWDQPLIHSAKGGVLGFICQKKNGILHFLIQGRVEPGDLDILEMAPTLQCTPANYDELPPYRDFLTNTRPDQIRYNTVQSEEGGRFYHDQNEYVVIEADEDEKFELPDNYVWMTIRQMKEFIRFNNYINIAARGLLSCLGISKPPS